MPLFSLKIFDLTIFSIILLLYWEFGSERLL